MVKIIVLLAVTAIAGVLSEAPVGDSYLPPGQSGVNNPDGSGALARNTGTPDTQYGVPSTSGFGGAGGLDSAGSPSANILGSPSGRIRTIPSYQYSINVVNGQGAQDGEYSASRSGQYSSSAGRFNAGSGFGGSSGRLSSQYGAPSPLSGNFGDTGSSGAPSSSSGVPGGASGLGGRLSSQYGAPSPLSGNFGATGSSGAPSSSSGVPGGASGFGGVPSGQQGDDQSEPANYEFSYEIQDSASGSNFGHLENGQYWDAIGEYRVILPDGRTQIVEYEADDEGYKPKIRYEVTAEGIAAAKKAEFVRQVVQKAALRAEKINKAKERLGRLGKPKYGPY